MSSKFFLSVILIIISGVILLIYSLINSNVIVFLFTIIIFLGVMLLLIDFSDWVRKYENEYSKTNQNEKEKGE